MSWCEHYKKTTRENRIIENALLEEQSAFQAFWTPISTYTNIDYQCVKSLSQVLAPQMAKGTSTWR